MKGALIKINGVKSSKAELEKSDGRFYLDENDKNAKNRSHVAQERVNHD